MKKLILLLCVLGSLFALSPLNEILTPKKDNRYYMMEKVLESKNETYDVQIYGSCHAYTSFNSMYLVNGYDISCFNMSNPGEIIPTTYLRMMERFKIDTPNVVLLETWGVNPYKTYTSTEDVLGNYFPVNIERLPLSREKLEVISDYKYLGYVGYIKENLPLIKYSSRLLELPFPEVEFNWSFGLAMDTYGDSSPYIYQEMSARVFNNGFYGRESNPILDYEEQQPDVGPAEMMAIEKDIMKYMDKIIDLCDEYGVTLIVYRAPYRSSVAELKKANFLGEYLKKRDILYIDLEREIDFDYSTDFFDYEHLSLTGANKATEYLLSPIFSAIVEHDVS